MTERITLIGQSQRDYAKRCIDVAPRFAFVTIAEPKRTNEQNRKMWPMLTDISKAKALGRCYTPDQWKGVMMQACGHHVQFLEGIDGQPFPFGFRSSQLTIPQMRDLIEFMYAFGAEQGIQWSDEVGALA